MSVLQHIFGHLHDCWQEGTLGAGMLVRHCRFGKRRSAGQLRSGGMGMLPVIVICSVGLKAKLPTGTPRKQNEKSLQNRIMHAHGMFAGGCFRNTTFTAFISKFRLFLRRGRAGEDWWNEHSSLGIVQVLEDSPFKR